MKNKTCTVLFLVTGLILLASVLAPMATAREGVWRADRVSPAAAPWLGAEMQISPSPSPDSGNRYHPAVAYNYVHKEYLVVWWNYWADGKQNIYARRVSESGQILGWFSVTTGTNNRLRPAVAYNATNDEYFVVWMYEASPNVYEIWGRRILWDGSYSYSEFRIFTWPDRSFHAPRVAWNSYRNEYLVIWNAQDKSSQPTDVAGCRISADGVIQPGAPIIITNAPNTYPKEADLVYNVALDGYMVVWARYSATDYDIYGAFLNRSGAKITPPGEFAVYSGASDQESPAVTTNEQNHYMVVWQHYSDSYDWDIYGRLFQVNGSPVTGAFAIANTMYNEEYPDVAANPASQEYLTVWRNYTTGVAARLRNADGTLAAPFDVWGYPADEPAVACGIPDFLIAYDKMTTTSGHIYGRLYWPEAVYLPLILHNQS